jgi:hypothetical protein
MNIEMTRSELKALLEFMIYAKHDHCSDKFNELSFDISNAQNTIENALQHPVYLNVYDVTRHYGGPEEGAWYYNAGELVETIETTEEKCDEVRVQLLEKHKDRNQGDIYSVLGGVLLEVQVDDTPGENWPSKRPHYE